MFGKMISANFFENRFVRNQANDEYNTVNKNENCKVIVASDYQIINLSNSGNWPKYLFL